MDALYITWVILLFLTILLYFIKKKDFANPVFLVSLSFFLSFTIVVYNIKNWDIAIYGYYWKTTLCILSAILSFAFGSFCLTRLTKTVSVNGGDVSSQISQRTKNYPYALFGIISFIVFLLFLKFSIGTINLLSLSGFKAALNQYYASGKEYNFFTSQLLELVVALAYISLHRVMIDRYYLKRKTNILLFVPIVFFLIGTLLYTDRNIFLRFMIFFLMIIIMSINWEGVSFRKNKKLIIRISILVLVIAVVFWVYGYLKEYTSNFERMVGIYAGSSLYAFNLWLNDFDGDYAMGKYTFSSIFRTLDAFGIGPGTDVSQNGDYIVFLSQNNYVFATNIYSALRDYYQDFGLVGIIIISILLGALFEKLYQLAIQHKYGFWWLFYCAHIYHVIYMPIVEQFFLRMHLGLVYEIFWLWALFYFVYGANGYWKYKIVYK